MNIELVLKFNNHLLQTFVYLFAPICGNIRETDFDANLRLVNGRKIWAAMWEYRHPDIDCFTAQVVYKILNTEIWEINLIHYFQITGPANLSYFGK